MRKTFALAEISQLPKKENENLFSEFNYMIITSVHGDLVRSVPIENRSQYFLSVKEFIGIPTFSGYIYFPSCSLLYTEALLMKLEENSGQEFAPQNKGGYLAQETGVNNFDTTNTCPRYWSRNVNKRFQKRDRVQLRKRVIDAWHLDTLRAQPNEDPFEYLQRRAFRFSDLRDRIVGRTV